MFPHRRQLGTEGSVTVVTCKAVFPFPLLPPRVRSGRGLLRWRPLTRLGTSCSLDVGADPSPQMSASAGSSPRSPGDGAEVPDLSPN